MSALYLFIHTHTRAHARTHAHAPTPLHNQKSVPGCREKREFIKLSHPRWAIEETEVEGRKAGKTAMRERGG